MRRRYSKENGNYHIYAIFDIRRQDDTPTYDQCYVLSAFAEIEGNEAYITELEALIPMEYF